MKTKDYELRAQVAKALGHPTRLLILDALQEKEMCVSELTELVGCDQSTVSKHIAILKGVGLVKDRKEGNSAYYRIVCPCIQQFFDCLEEVVFKNAERYQRLCGPKCGRR
jgi:ArsR family transcriptional regulator